MLRNRINYFRRIFRVYLTKNKGYLSFWHEKPEISSEINPNDLGCYYQTFFDKAHYQGPKDENGVILFDYFFDIGLKYNPLAIAQYGLGHFNLYLVTKKKVHLEIAQRQADWLLLNLEPNDFGLMVWKHHFPWHYKQWLKPGWYSAHAQGCGISLLLRIYKETKDEKYLLAAEKAFEVLDTEIKKGGVKFIDEENNVWLEEYLLEPPTHVLNGFFWALWGVWDYYLFTHDERAKKLWFDCLKTLKNKLFLYDAGFWSLYDLSQQKLKMLASPFYHSLHIVQLEITYLLSQEKIFKAYATKFLSYQKNNFCRLRALIYKIIFKLVYF